jgi:hypothetical protein
VRLHSPDDFTGPRVYFVGFDRRKVRNVRNIPAWSLRTIRRLKTLLLTKRMIIVGASHLNSAPVFSLLRKHPILLEAGLIVPALRSDISEVADCVTVRGALGNEMKNFYRSTVCEVVTWDHSENSAGFRNGMLKALSDQHSVLSNQLSNLREAERYRLKAELHRASMLSRRDLDRLTSAFDPSRRRAIRRFGNLLYYLSGANIVKCESTLHHIEYMDYALPDMIAHKTTLDSETIFWKLFVELVFNSFNASVVPMESLDSLSFSDIEQIRKPILESGFCEDYDKMLQGAMAKVEQNQDVSLPTACDSLLELRESIARTFRESVELQKAAFVKTRKKTLNINIAKSTLHFGVGLAGLIPVVGTPFGLVGTARSGNELFTSIVQRIDVDRLMQDRRETLLKIVESVKFSDKHKLIDAVAFIGEIIASKYRI